MKLTKSDLTNFDLYRSDNIKPELKSAMALTALDILNKLPCGEKRPRNGQKPAKGADMNKFYLRDEYFRRPGINDDENEADKIKTYNKTLLRDLTNTTIQHGPYGIYVTGGDLHCLYTGCDISFRYDSSTNTKISSVIEVDHVVPLEDVWRSDRGLSPQARHELFGNELEVQAVAKIVNRKKGAGAFGEWPIMRRQDSKCNSNSNNYKPKKFNKLYLTQYAVRQVVIKDLYGLRVSSDERKSLKNVLTRAAKQA